MSFTPPPDQDPSLSNRQRGKQQKIRRASDDSSDDEDQLVPTVVSALDSRPWEPLYAAHLDQLQHIENIYKLYRNPNFVTPADGPIISFGDFSDHDHVLDFEQEDFVDDLPAQEPAFNLNDAYLAAAEFYLDNVNAYGLQNHEQLEYHDQGVGTSGLTLEEREGLPTLESESVPEQTPAWSNGDRGRENFLSPSGIPTQRADDQSSDSEAHPPRVPGTRPPTPDEPDFDDPFIVGEGHALVALGGGPAGLEINRFTWQPPERSDTEWGFLPTLRSNRSVLIWQTYAIGLTMILAVPLWGPMPIPDPPAFPDWIHHLGSLQVPTVLDIKNFLGAGIFRDEIWATIISMAFVHLRYYEFIAPWYSGHELRRHTIVMHLILSWLSNVGRLRGTVNSQPGTTFLNPVSGVRYYFGFIQRPVVSIIDFAMQLSNGRRTDILRVNQNMVMRGIESNFWGHIDTLREAFRTMDGFLRHDPVIDFPGGLVLRFSGHIFVERLIDLAFISYDFREHFFGLRYGSMGVSDTLAGGGTIPNGVFAAVALITFIHAVGILLPHGGATAPGPLRAHGRYREMINGQDILITHAERYNILLNLVAAERARHPVEFQMLERRIFEIAHDRGARIMIPIEVPALGDPSVDWEQLVEGDGRAWYAYRN